MMRRTAAILILALSAALGGCGYSLVGGKPSGAPVKVELAGFYDESREPMFGPVFRRELARRTVERSGVELSSGGLTLTVRLMELKETPQAFRRNDVPAEYLIIAGAEVTLTSGSETLVKNHLVTARGEFAAGGDIAETRANKNRALQSVADKLAGLVLARVAEGARRPGEGAGGGR